MATSIPYQMSFIHQLWCFRVPSWLHLLFPGKSCANIILDLQVTKTPTDTGSYIRIMSTIFLLKWCHWQNRKGFFCLKNQPEKKHVWEMEEASTILEGSKMESTFVLTFPCQRWRQKHTHSRHLNSLTDWKSLWVFTFKWRWLKGNKGCSFSTLWKFCKPRTSQIIPPAVPVEVHGNPQHRRGARTSMLILRYSSNVWSTKRHIYRYRRG